MPYRDCHAHLNAAPTSRFDDYGEHLDLAARAMPDADRRIEPPPGRPTRPGVDTARCRGPGRGALD